VCTTLNPMQAKGTAQAGPYALGQQDAKQFSTHVVPDEVLGHQAAQGTQEGPATVYDLCLQWGTSRGVRQAKQACQ
jgi:hypothetical protein